MLYKHIKSPFSSIISPSFIRLQSTASSTTEFEIHNEKKQLPPPILNKDSIYIISLPITTTKSFIYCNHRPSLLNTKVHDKIPVLLKVEDKLVNLAKKGWNKLATSKSSINIKITKFIEKLLSTIPYEETCLTSFPNKQIMIREINEESLETSKSEQSLTTQSEIEKLNISSDQLNPIPLYHPNSQYSTTILNQLYTFRTENEEKHKKYSILCAIGIPLTLPFALVPIVPNVPGFYVAYRLYCHIKALLGIKHLNYLLEKPISDNDEIADKTTINDTSHIAFKTIDEIDEIYQKFSEHDLVSHLNNDEQNEQLVITEEIIKELSETLDLHHIKDDLLKALHQETTKLNNSQTQEQIE